MKYFVALILCLGIVGTVRAKSPEYFLYYNVDSPHLEEIDIESDEILKVFDDNFGPAAEELPQEVRLADYYVSRYTDGRYVFMLNAPFNCGALGCNTEVYVRDEDGDLYYIDSSFPVKCEKHEDDKRLCQKAGYKKKAAKPAAPKKKIIHYYPPKNAAREE